MKTSVLEKKITMYKRADTPDESHQVLLLDVLRSDKYKALADKCSQITDKKERQRFKLQNVPAITPSGVFKDGRKAGNLLQHTGLICLDLDGVEDIRNLKGKVSDLPFVAYCGRSISGSGLFTIIHIPESTPEEHKQRYAALERHFIKEFGIHGAVDPQPKNVAACRYVSYDPEPYFNHDAAVYTGLNKQNPLHSKSDTTKYNNSDYIHHQSYANDNDLNKVSEMVRVITERNLDFCPDYDSYLRVAFSLANFGEQGRELFHSVCQFSPKYERRNADAKFTNALKNGRSQISLGTFFSMCDDYGLMQKKDNWKIFRPPPIKRTEQATDYSSSWDEETIDLFQDDLTQSEHKPDEYIETDQLLQERPQKQPRTPNKAVEQRKIITPDSYTIEAYTNRQNELLIQNPMDANRLTVYPDIDSYNRRTVKPESRYKNTVVMNTLTPVTIDPDKLMVISISIQSLDLPF